MWRFSMTEEQHKNTMEITRGWTRLGSFVSGVGWGGGEGDVSTPILFHLTGREKQGRFWQFNLETRISLNPYFESSPQFSFIWWDAKNRVDFDSLT